MILCAGNNCLRGENSTTPKWFLATPRAPPRQVGSLGVFLTLRPVLEKRKLLKTEFQTHRFLKFQRFMLYLGIVNQYAIFHFAVVFLQIHNCDTCVQRVTPQKGFILVSLAKLELFYAIVGQLLLNIHRIRLP